MSDRLSAIRERLEKITPGEWRVVVSGQNIEVRTKGRTPVVSWLGFDDSDRPFGEHEANAHLIASAPADVRWLLSIAEAAAAYREAMNERWRPEAGAARSRLFAALEEEPSNGAV